MNILLLEDDGAVAISLEGYLEDMGHKVFLADNISSAKDKYENKKIDCFIVDLNMETTGLSEEEIAKSRNGNLTGWFWWKNYLLAREPSVNKRTIFLTAYYDVLGDFLKKEGEEALLKEITVISKEFSEDEDFDVDELKRVLKKTEKGLSK